MQFHQLFLFESIVYEDTIARELVVAVESASATNVLIETQKG